MSDISDMTDMTAQPDRKTVLDVSKVAFCYAPSATSVDWSLSNLSLKVRAEEIVCILGASGCGKSTLLNLVAGLIKPNSGTVKVTAHGEGNRRIGYIFQNDALLPWRTVESNLMLVCQVSKEVSRESARSRIAQYLSTFHLNEQILKQFPAQLSGGMRQRVSIIQSLMFNPELLLLDEPFSALDFNTKLSLESEFYQLVKERGKAAILVTHDIEEAIAMADRVLIMRKGGTITNEFVIDLPDQNRSPENARGTPRFADYYREIWSELKVSMVENTTMVEDKNNG
jgi:NitT/TauT family transport system ATP-binding protein